ncbi:restriction endonuclease [Enterococcus cecorum]|uniref:restriction endonuclease n=1 Tax=Enterococcus cecorum TaxID=44008 RepID=UPI001FAE5569|nr:restriction endonuclease [Enterococcus cecorum]MCJ0558391.1 restriction endonuclease [Enterococcus cecorum]
MIRDIDIKNHLKEYDFDIKKNNNARWIDQKCTPDVVSIIADCIIQYDKDKANNKNFTSSDIWHYQYTEENIRDIFNKPSTEKATTRNEYDKFFSQPLEMLANARILSKQKIKNRNIYSINRKDILDYIAIRERNALNFIVEYCGKVLLDSGILNLFENFFDLQTKESYEQLKDNYEIFIIANTPINNRVEVRRIFTKVINPLAYSHKKKGSLKGRISKNPITYAELMYNRENFRDINLKKPKGMTRKEWESENKQKVNIKYYKYQAIKAKRFLREFNDRYRNRKSELLDEFSAGDATQMHHIFPEHEYPEISMYLENLIALTPTQHLTKAHPKNNTHRIDPTYQELLLKAKAGSIKDNIFNVDEETIYDFNNFVEVLNVGFDKNYIVDDNDFVTVMMIINQYYAA